MCVCVCVFACVCVRIVSFLFSLLRDTVVKWKYLSDRGLQMFALLCCLKSPVQSYEHFAVYRTRPADCGTRPDIVLDFWIWWYHERGCHPLNGSTCSCVIYTCDTVDMNTKCQTYLKHICTVSIRLYELCFLAPFSPTAGWNSHCCRIHTGPPPLALLTMDRNNSP